MIDASSSRRATAFDLCACAGFQISRAGHCSLPGLAEIARPAIYSSLLKELWS